MPTSGPWSENYLLIACGSSHHARFLSGWQEFKDHLRRVIEYQPGWTNVTEGMRRGEMQGWCRIDLKSDAEAAYNHYSASRGILVHLFKTSRTSDEFRLVKCNCWQLFPEVSEQSHSPERSGITPGGVNQYVARAYGTAVPQYMAQSPALYAYIPYPHIPTYTAQPPYTMHGTQMQSTGPHMPIYSATTSGIPVNVRHGAMITEARGIFINNLNYSVNPSELHSLLCSVGQPVECRLHRDSKTGAFKGNATAKFATKQEAVDAANGLNGMQHMGMTLRARLDTDTTVVGQVDAPVIVNGSISRV